MEWLPWQVGESAKNHGSSAENKLRGETAGPQCHGLGGGLGSASGIWLVRQRCGWPVVPPMSGWLSEATYQSCLCCWTFAYTVLLPETPVPHSHLAHPLTSFRVFLKCHLYRNASPATLPGGAFCTSPASSFHLHAGIIWEETSYFYPPRSLVRAPVTKDRLTKEKKTEGQ